LEKSSLVIALLNINASFVYLACQVQLSDTKFNVFYQVAVDAIIASNTLQQPKWRSLDFMLQDTSSLIELGMMRCAKDLMQAQAEMMDILKCAHELSRIAEDVLTCPNLADPDLKKGHATDSLLLGSCKVLD
jgi:hypothetical protein